MSAVESSGDGHADNGRSQLGLGRLLRARYERAGDPDDLTAVIALVRQSAELASGPITLADCQSELAAALRLRFERAGDTADLAEAGALSSAAAEAIPVGYPNAGRVRFAYAAVLDAQGRHQQAEPGRAPAAAPAALTKTELIGAVSARVDRFEADDRSPVLEPGAAGDARQLSELLTAEGRDDLDAWETLGLFWYMRLLSLPAEADAERDEAVNGAVRGYLPLFLAGREVPERLLAAVAEEARTFDTRTSAQALHDAVRALRDKRDMRASPSYWAPFLHAGA